MALDNIQLSIVHGEDKTFQFNVKQADGVTAQNVTGWSILFSAKIAGVLWTQVPTVVDATNGVIAVTVNRAVSVTWGAKPYSFDVWRVDAGSNVELGSGTLTVKPAVRADS